MVFHHRGHVSQSLRFGVVDRHLGQVFRRRDGQDMSNAEPLIRGLDPPAGAGCRGLQEAQWRRPQGVASGFDDLHQRHAVISQLFRIHLHLQLPLTPAPDRHVRHAGHTQQARLDRPASEHRHVDEGQFVRGHPDRHDPAGRGDGIDHGEMLRHSREREHLVETLLRHLPGAHEVGPLLEDENDGRQPGDGHGAELLHPGGPVEQVRFHGGGDQGLHFLGGKAEELDLNLHVRPRELGQDIHRHVAELRETEHHQQRRDRRHDESKLQARADDPTHHG